MTRDLSAVHDLANQLGEEVAFLRRFPTDNERRLFRGRTDAEISEMIQWIEEDWSHGSSGNRIWSAGYHGAEHGVRSGGYRNYHVYLSRMHELLVLVQRGLLTRVPLRRQQGQVAATYTVSGTNEFLSVDRHEKIVTGGFNR